MIEKYSDESDRATAIEESERDYLVSEIRRAAQGPSMKPVGTCYYCGEDVRHPRLFCDNDCADGHKQLQAARQRNNGVR